MIFYSMGIEVLVDSIKVDTRGRTIFMCGLVQFHLLSAWVGFEEPTNASEDAGF